MKKSLVITGHTGLVGGELLANLSEEFEIFVLARNFSTISGVTVLDIYELEKNFIGLSEKVPHGSTIIHCAALINGKFNDYWTSNVELTRRLLDFGVAIRSNQFIYFSTGSVYGYNSKIYVDEKHPINPLNTYGHTKYIGEQLVSMYSEEFSLPATTFRLYFPFSDRRSSGIFKLIPDRILSGLPLSLNVGGAPRFQPIHCLDILEAVKCSLNKEPGGHRIYNLCGNEEFSFQELAQLYAKSLDSMVYFDKNETVVGDLLANISQLRSDFAWSPRHDCSVHIINSAKILRQDC
jgi:nucleoside-diphosphate-sugar epimerase